MQVTNTNHNVLGLVDHLISAVHEHSDVQKHLQHCDVARGRRLGQASDRDFLQLLGVANEDECGKDRK